MMSERMSECQFEFDVASPALLASAGLLLPANDGTRI